jgi:chromosomal replication initiation ATPase DnaA
MHSRYILNYVAQMFEVSPIDIQQESRGRQSVAKARDVYFYLLEATGKSHNEIAKIGRRERSSVTCAIKRTKEAMKKEEFLRKRIERLLDTVMNVTINEPAQ